MNYYEHTLIALAKDTGEKYLVQKGNYILRNAFQLLGEKAFNNQMLGAIEYSYSLANDPKYSVTLDNMDECICEIFHKAFRQADISDRFNGKCKDVEEHVTVSTRQKEIVSREVSTNTVIDMLIWHSLGTHHTFWKIVKAFSKAYICEKLGEKINFNNLLDDVLDY